MEPPGRTFGAPEGELREIRDKQVARVERSETRGSLSIVPGLRFAPPGLRCSNTQVTAGDNENEESGTTMKTSKSSAREAKGGDSPAQLIDARIAALGDWRGETLARVRKVIQEADPEVVEEVKWRKPSNPMGVPVWEHAGIVCTGETYKDKVKLTFAKGAALEDPSGLFNASLDGSVRRAIDFHEGDKIDEKALKALIRGAVALNTSVRATARPVRPQKKPKSA
jgi:hypothetical protein